VRYLVAIGYPLPKLTWPLVADYHSWSTQAQAATWPITLYFDNSNIYPKSEYQARLQAVKKIAALLKLPLKIADYCPREYFALPACRTQLQRGQNQQHRCQECQTWRLQRAYTNAVATLTQFTTDTRVVWSTTMLVSPYLNQLQIKTIARTLNNDPRLSFSAKPWRVKPQLIKTKGFFKQNYCGCLFSLYQRTQEKFCNLKTGK
jgi:predicted adenine nucleotide alpha hydrolase (AANH) superfamily ATPase